MAVTRDLDVLAIGQWAKRRGWRRRRRGRESERYDEGVWTRQTRLRVPPKLTAHRVFLFTLRVRVRLFAHRAAREAAKRGPKNAVNLGKKVIDREQQDESLRVISIFKEFAERGKVCDSHPRPCGERQSAQSPL